MKVIVILNDGVERGHDADTWGFSEGWLHIADSRIVGRSTEIAAYNGTRIVSVELVRDEPEEAPAP